MDLSPGDPIRVVMTKWGERPHWEFDGFYLGSDEHGDWLGFPAGTLMSRPGVEVRPENDQVGLVPVSGAWLATFHGPGGSVQTYVDMTSVPEWAGSVVHAVDLDLDVIKPLDGAVYVDDEDEFAEHQVAFGYPAATVELAESARDEVLAAVTQGTAPFDGSSDRWLAVLTEHARR